MTARLSPAQQRVADAMRDGAALIGAWSGEKHPYLDGALRRRWHLHAYTAGRMQRTRVATRTARALEARGVIESSGDPDLVIRRYVLTPAYRGGEA